MKYEEDEKLKYEEDEKSERNKIFSYEGNICKNNNFSFLPPPLCITVIFHSLKLSFR